MGPHGDASPGGHGGTPSEEAAGGAGKSLTVRHQKRRNLEESFVKVAPVRKLRAKLVKSGGTPAKGQWLVATIDGAQAWYKLGSTTAVCVYLSIAIPNCCFTIKTPDSVGPLTAEQSDRPELRPKCLFALRWGYVWRELALNPEDYAFEGIFCVTSGQHFLSVWRWLSLGFLFAARNLTLRMGNRSGSTSFVESWLVQSWTSNGGAGWT